MLRWMPQALKRILHLKNMEKCDQFDYFKPMDQSTRCPSNSKMCLRGHKLLCKGQTKIIIIKSLVESPPPLSSKLLLKKICAPSLRHNKIAPDVIPDKIPEEADSRLHPTNTIKVNHFLFQHISVSFTEFIPFLLQYRLSLS